MNKITYLCSMRKFEGEKEEAYIIRHEAIFRIVTQLQQQDYLINKELRDTEHYYKLAVLQYENSKLKTEK